MASEPIKSLSVALWGQPAGPNTAIEYFGCHAITSVTRPRGNNTLNYCPDPVHPGRYVVSSKTKAPPGLVTYSIESKMYKLFSHLETIKCPFPVIAQVVDCSPKDEYWNWVRAFIFTNSDPVQEGISNLLTMSEENEVMMTFDMEADEMLRLAKLRIARDSSIAETQALNHVFACDLDICAGPCGAANAACDTLYAVSDAVSGSASGKGSLWIMQNDTWTAAAADPFATSEHIIGGTCFALDRSTRRVLVFRGSTDAAAPAEAAYTDDGGATWTLVNIGASNAEFVISSKAIHALNQNNIWVGTNLGRIYFSSDGGGTWVAQENQGIHAAAWNWVQMLDDRNGFAGGVGDVIATTTDGGQVWSQVNATGQGGDITAGAVIDVNNFWVGTDDGELFFTTDAGVTWTQRVGFSGSGIGRVDDIRFINSQVGYVSMRNATPKSTLLTTRFGGFNWETIDTPTNAGVNSLIACGLGLLYAVGEASGGKPVIYKAQPVG